MNSRTRKSSKNSYNTSRSSNQSLDLKLTTEEQVFKNGQYTDKIHVKKNRENITLHLRTENGHITNKQEGNELFYFNDEDQDALLEENVSKSVQTKKNMDIHFNERKFFKRSYPENNKNSECSSPRTGEYQDESVCKVFKILSKSISPPDLPQNKPVSKLSLKTYSTPRAQRTRIIETFGLPDNPIVPEIPLENSELDVNISDAKEVTVCDLPTLKVHEMLPVKQYEKAVLVNNVNCKTEMCINTTPDHKGFIEKMKCAIRRILEDNPTDPKQKYTSTPIKSAKSDKINCDISISANGTADLGDINVKHKTALFTPPKLTNKKKNKNKISSKQSEEFRKKLRSSEHFDECNKMYKDSLENDESQQKLELKILLNPLNKIVTSPEHQHNDNSLKMHSREVDTSIVGLILHDWENTDAEIVANNFNESPSEKSNCCNAFTMLPIKEDLKYQEEKTDKQIEMLKTTFKEEDTKVEIEELTKKEEIDDGINVSVIQCKPLEVSVSSRKQEKLIFDTHDHLEFDINKENILVQHNSNENIGELEPMYNNIHLDNSNKVPDIFGIKTKVDVSDISLIHPLVDSSGSEDKDSVVEDVSSFSQENTFHNSLKPDTQEDSKIVQKFDSVDPKLLSEDHDTFNSIENSYHNENVRKSQKLNIQNILTNEEKAENRRRSLRTSKYININNDIEEPKCENHQNMEENDEASKFVSIAHKIDKFITEENSRNLEIKDMQKAINTYVDNEHLEESNELPRRSIRISSSLKSDAVDQSKDLQYAESNSEVVEDNYHLQGHDCIQNTSLKNNDSYNEEVKEEPEQIPRRSLRVSKGTHCDHIFDKSKLKNDDILDINKETGETVKTPHLKSHNFDFEVYYKGEQQSVNNDIANIKFKKLEKIPNTFMKNDLETENINIRSNTNVKNDNHINEYEDSEISFNSRPTILENINEITKYLGSAYTNGDVNKSTVSGDLQTLDTSTHKSVDTKLNGDFISSKKHSLRRSRSLTKKKIGSLQFEQNILEKSNAPPVSTEEKEQFRDTTVVGKEMSLQAGQKIFQENEKMEIKSQTTLDTAEENTPTPKKKQGRPPKVKEQCSAKSESGNACDDIFLKTFNIDGVEKVKSIVKGLQLVEDGNCLGKTLVTPRRRGRPKKQPVPPEETSGYIENKIQENVELTSVVSPDIIEENIKSPRKRGRPPKFKLPNIECSSTKQEDTNLSHSIVLEEVEAELVAIECNKDENSFAPLFNQLTRSKSRIALNYVESDLQEIYEGMKMLQRSKTSLGLVCKESPEFKQKPRGRQRVTIDTSEIQSLKARRRRSRSVPRIAMETLSPKKNTRSSNGNQEVLKLGTLAWARIGCHPFWPCLVTRDPESNVCSKEKSLAGRLQLIYHVRFFGDKGKRAWVLESKILLYNSKDDVDELLKKAKLENKPHVDRLPYIIRASYQEKWNKAVNEAEQLKSKEVSDRLDFFEQLDKQRKIEKLARKQERGASDGTKRKRRDSINTISSDISQITDFQDDVSPSRKRYKGVGVWDKDDGEKKNQTPNAKQKTTNSKKNKLEGKDGKLRISEKSDSEPVVIPPYVPILDNENILPSRTRSGLHSDGNSDIVSKVSSEKSDVLDPFSTDAQRTLFKRNNLFRGVSKEKVCHYCFQPDMVFKCTKGGCNGLYHLSCAIDVMSGEEYKKKLKKKNSTLLQNIQANSNENLDLSFVSVKKEESNSSEDRVQIVTVTSNVYNSPPRKTFPDNFREMTLAEQIDYKMKEIMNKFAHETPYAESSSDSSSEKNVGSKPFLKSNSSSLRLSFEEMPLEQVTNCGKPVDKHNGKLPIAHKKSRSSLIRHVTAESVFEISSDDSSPSTGSLEPAKNRAKSNVKKQLSNESDSEKAPWTTISQHPKDVDPKHFKCGFCLSHQDPFCFVCFKAVSQKGSSIRQKCSLYQCGRYYHPECLKLWPQTQWSFVQRTKHKMSKEDIDTFVCPQHVCHTCASDDPRAATSRCPGDKIVKCLKCPSSYHSTNFCIPAGTEMISTAQVICPRHRDRNKSTINTTWCFLCNEGGNLICCETCPTSVHPECMPVNLTDDDKFICEDCESGRLPLYDEVVWVKLGSFRWWPALILFPNEVPVSVMNARHNSGEFVVKFFGTYDYYWVSRNRAFLFQDGDAGQSTNTKKKVDEAFKRAVEEAVVAHSAKKEFKRTRVVEAQNSLKPPPYIRIKVNRPVGNVRLLDLDLSSTTSCECDPNNPNPCGPDSDCLNRLLMTECNPDACPAGQRCKNQCFEKRDYPPLTPHKTEGRGWGLKTLAPIKKGQFVIEYVGELIDMDEYQRRIQKMHEQKEENYYFLTIDKDRMIDAGPKGNMARFMNHCCQPNCETQKWTVNGDTRVGLFATVDISADTELTFNYNLECAGKERKICMCGAPTCSGFIGVQKDKQDSEVKRPKKVHKKKKPTQQAVLPPCFICQRKGSVGLCNNKVCNKAYHLRCLNMREWPEGNKFVCPWHNCNICSKRTIRCCVKCINSFCPSHSDGNIRYDKLLGFVCSSHDPSKPSADIPVKVKSRKSNVITEESAITSTTSDDSDNEDKLTLSEVLKTEGDEIPVSKPVKKGKASSSNNTSDEEFEVTASNSLGVTDDSFVSSVSSCGSDESKRKRPAKKNDQTRKKIKLSKLGYSNKRKSTARKNVNCRQLDDR